MNGFRDPRIGMAVAVVAAIVTGWMFARAGEPAAEAWLLALVGFALAGWGWLAIAATTWFRARPSEAKVARAVRLLRSQHAFNTAAWNRFDRDAAMLKMLMAERALQPIEEELQRHGRTVERFEDVAGALPAWSRAAAHWYDTAAQAHPAIPSATPVPSSQALAAAEEQLPFGTKLAGDDLRAALHYLAARRRMATDRAAIERERAGALRKLASGPPQRPTEDDPA